MALWLELAAGVPQAWVLAGVAAPWGWLVGLARPLPVPPAGPERAIAVLVPAHDEAAVIGALVRDLAAQAYPAGRLTVLVIADGCTDGTAAIARRLGAEVLELTARLAARGVAVAFAPEVRARDEKVDDGAAFAGQRARWIRGRFAVGLGWGPRLLAAAPGRHRELGAYLLLPMRAMTLAGAAAFTALGLIGAPGVWPWPLWLALLALVPAQLVAGL